MKMMITKLKVFMLLAACVCGLGAKAEVTETFTFSTMGYTNAADVTDVVSGEVKLVFAKGSNKDNSPKYYATGTGIRFYGGNTLTVSVPEGGMITSVAFSFASGASYAPSANPAASGNYANNTWTGNAETSIEFTRPSGSGHWRIQKVAVTYAEPAMGGVAAPEISLPTETYRGEQTVTITAEEGAKVYYTLDGTDPTTESNEYTAPFALTETTTVKAIAVKGGETSRVATSVITIMPEVANIAAFIEAGTKAVLTLADAVVTAKNASNVYIQDATGALVIYGSVPTCQIGDKVSGTIIGEYSEYKDHAHQLLNGDFTNAVFTAGGELAPAEVTLAELIANAEAYHMHLVTVKGCTYANMEITQGEETVKFYDSLKMLSSGYTWPVSFDFTGIFLNYQTNTPELIARSEEDIVNRSALESPTFKWSAANVDYDLAHPVALPTLTSTSDGKVTYSSSNEAVAIVNESGEVTVLGEGTTTITASVAATDTYAAAMASYTLKVSDSSAMGEAMAFVATMQKSGTQYALSTGSSKSKVMDAVEVYTVNGKVVNADVTTLSWYVDKENGTIQTADGKYLTATSGKTDLSVATASCKWTWDETDGIFKLGSRSFLVSEGTGFKNYAVSNANTANYSGYTEMMSFADGHIRSGLTEDTWGTICLPNAVAEADVKGATFYSVAGKTEIDGVVTGIVLGEPATTLQAGVPYVFSAAATDLIAAYNGEAVETAAQANGLCGTLAAINGEKDADDTQLSGKYMLVGNVWKLCGKGCSLAANRAYLDMEAVPAVEPAANAVVLSVFFDNETGIQGVNAADAAVDVYTVSGVRVRTSVSAAAATEGLQKGLYIINGKKTLVK
ncbi:MAG: chitobiase/beta-hexosaminidase C-terminal domain-containing protein [Clostridium sp.]|nr:chitobiase/beta-hexosaminidase C-terminal domain-containing protein [Clostridium sp.]